MADPTGPVTPGQHEVSGVSGREQRTVEGEQQQLPGKAFKIEQGPDQVKSTEEASPLELAKQGAQRGELSTSALDEQMERIGGKVKALRQELSSARFDQLTPGQRSLLETKFSQFNGNLSALSKQMGLTYKAKGKQKSPLKTYVGWLTDGQAQMQSIGKNLANKGPGEISTAQMLRAQAQLQAAERAINFATAVASKSADFIKTMMQTQV